MARSRLERLVAGDCRVPNALVCRLAFILLTDQELQPRTGSALDPDLALSYDLLALSEGRHSTRRRPGRRVIRASSARRGRPITETCTAGSWLLTPDRIEISRVGLYTCTLSAHAAMTASAAMTQEE